MRVPATATSRPPSCCGCLGEGGLRVAAFTCAERGNLASLQPNSGQTWSTSAKPGRNRPTPDQLRTTSAQSLQKSVHIKAVAIKTWPNSVDIVPNSADAEPSMPHIGQALARIGQTSTGFVPIAAKLGSTSNDFDLARPITKRQLEAPPENGRLRLGFGQDAVYHVCACANFTGRAPMRPWSAEHGHLGIWALKQLRRRWLTDHACLAKSTLMLENIGPNSADFAPTMSNAGRDSPTPGQSWQISRKVRSKSFPLGRSWAEPGKHRTTRLHTHMRTAHVHTLPHQVQAA